MGKIKVLALMDYACATGFANVASNIMQQLYATEKYDVTIVGINYDPATDYDPQRFPGHVKPAMSISNMQTGDVYGRQRFLDELGKGLYDICFIIQDTFIVQSFVQQIVETNDGLQKKFATILYYPFDSTPKREWVEQCVALIDFPVPYTNYAKDLTLGIMPELADKLVQPIYHGTNLRDFSYLEDRHEVKKFRHEWFSGKADDKFIVTNVNRNQIRKDIPRTFAVLRELKDRGHEDIAFYLHMAHDDAGGNLLVMADNYGLKLGEDFFLPSPRIFAVNQGVSFEIMNLIYNTSDAMLTTTFGEGWGLSITEAMATKTPIVAPGNTSINEILADGRGYLAKSGATFSDWVSFGGQDNERLRPQMDVKEAADKLELIKQGTLPDIEAAYTWANHFSWDEIGKDWLRVFERAANKAQKDTENFVPSTMSRQQRRAMERKHANLQA